MVFSFFTIRATGQKWRTVTFHFQSKLKKSRTNIEGLTDSTRDHSNKNNLETAEAAVRRCSSK